MLIQWFPGHMTKALRMMEKEIKLVDTIIYVLDARAPFSCVNPKFGKLIGEKHIIYVINKSDMGDVNKIKGWQSYFSKLGTCIVLNSTQSGAGKKIEQAIVSACCAKTEKLKLKGITAVLRAMVLGVPNSGKSTLINNLCNKGKAITGDKPGVTKMKQWVRIGRGIELLDTPGTLWPAFDNELVAKHLAYIGSIKEEVLDIPSLALEFLSEIKKLYPEKLKQRYMVNFNEETTTMELYEAICKKRGFLLKGGDYDYDRCASAIITDFKQNRFNGITLESVNDIKNLTIKNRTEKRK